jgi:Signal peptidase, peptidase S26
MAPTLPAGNGRTLAEGFTYHFRDNRSFAQDSRDFGPVPRAAIFARVFLIDWPFGRFGSRGYNRHLTPPGDV